MGAEVDGDAVAELGTELKGFFPSRNIMKSHRDCLAGVGVGVGAEALDETALRQKWKLQSKCAEIKSFEQIGT